MTFTARTLILFSVAVIFACKGDEDGSPPRIVITSPSGNAPTYSYNDAFAVRFTATDNEGVERWQVRLSDESGTRRFSTDYFTVAGTPASTEQQITVVCDDVHWPSGDYTLAVFAADAAGNEGAAFQTIRYFEAPLERKGIAVLRAISGAPSVIDTLSAAGSFSTAASLPGSFSGLLAGSFHGEWLAWSAGSANLLFLDPEAFAAAGSASFQNPLDAQFFHDVVFESRSRSYFVSCFDGLIREFGKGGALRSTIATGPNLIPKDLWADDTYIYASLQAVNSSDIGLFARYFRNSGAVNTTTAVAGTHFSIVPYDGTVLLIGTKPTGEGVVYLANPSTLSLSELPWLAGDAAIRHAIELDNGDYALASAAGVAMYRFGTGQFIPASANGVNAMHLAYDPVGNAIYATTENTVFRINRSNGAVTASYPTSNAVATAVLLNK